VTNPVPVLAGLTPNTTYTGSPNIYLTLTGDKFIRTPLVTWNGVRLSTRYVSSQVLVVKVPHRLLDVPGVKMIVVRNKTPGGGISAAQSFTVQ
jgi:hypothetical protein